MHKRAGLITISNSSGMSLMEMTTTMAIAAIVVLGLSAFFTDMFRMQKRGNVVNMLMQKKTSIIAAIQANSSNALQWSSWQVTVDDVSTGTGNPNFACLKNHTECLNNQPAELLNLKSRAGDTNGEEFIYSRIATRGFTPDGTICDTFSSTGSPLCPFRYKLEWQAHCVGGSVIGAGAGIKTSCLDPQIEVQGTLEYAPGASDPLGGQAFNPAMYAINVRRGEGIKTNIPIVVSNVVDETARLGEGACTGGGADGVARKFNTLTDPSELPAGVAADSFTLKPGRYECRIEVPAFKNGWNVVKLMTTGGVVAATANGIASFQGGSTSVSLQANLVVSTDTTFQVMHKCESNPAIIDPSGLNGSNNANWSMGVPTSNNGDYTKVIYTIVSCMKTG